MNTQTGRQSQLYIHTHIHTHTYIHTQAERQSQLEEVSGALDAVQARLDDGYELPPVPDNFWQHTYIIRNFSVRARELLDECDCAIGHCKAQQKSLDEISRFSVRALCVCVCVLHMYIHIRIYVRVHIYRAIKHSRNLWMRTPGSRCVCVRYIHIDVYVQLHICCMIGHCKGTAEISG